MPNDRNETSARRSPLTETPCSQLSSRQSTSQPASPSSAKLAKTSGRPSVRRQAASDLIRIATQLDLSEELDPKARADDKPRSELRLIDPKAAAEELARRQALKK